MWLFHCELLSNGLSHFRCHTSKSRPSSERFHSQKSLLDPLVELLEDTSYTLNDSFWPAFTTLYSTWTPYVPMLL